MLGEVRGRQGQTTRQRADSHEPSLCPTELGHVAALGDVARAGCRSGDNMARSLAAERLVLATVGRPAPPGSRSARTPPVEAASLRTAAAVPAVEDGASNDSRGRSTAAYENPSAGRASGIGGGTRRPSVGTFPKRLCRAACT